MPRLSRWLLRLALGHLLLGLTVGALLLADKGVGVTPGLWRLFPAHVECLLVGWTVQLAMGVAFWILPRFAGGASRGNEALAWWALGLVNSGVLLAGLAPAAGARTGVVVLGRAAEVTGALAFAAHAWRRVRPPSVYPAPPPLPGAGGAPPPPRSAR